MLFDVGGRLESGIKQFGQKRQSDSKRQAAKDPGQKNEQLSWANRFLNQVRRLNHVYICDSLILQCRIDSSLLRFFRIGRVVGLAQRNLLIEICDRPLVLIEISCTVMELGQL